MLANPLPSIKFLALGTFPLVSPLHLRQLFLYPYFLSSLYAISLSIRYVDISESPIPVLLYFTELLHLFIWINFNFSIDSFKILAPTIHILFENM